MNKKFEKLLTALIPIAERVLSIVAFVFPLVEVASYFGPKVFLSTENVALRFFY